MYTTFPTVVITKKIVRILILKEFGAFIFFDSLNSSTVSYLKLTVFQLIRELSNTNEAIPKTFSIY